MNIDQFNQLLEQQFKITASEQVHDAQVWRLRKPRSLAPLLDKALEGEDELDEFAGTFEAWPGNVWALLEQHGLAPSLLTLN